ncbi:MULTISPECIES: beta-ketoacyl-ACP synthase II [Aerococcus]|uniref:beta-ketoacyl-ACP synthase II n=1 Tax=Aerococcus TaxID=1375 RepID=UPI0008A55A96|nr:MULTISPECIES: beta-ketoacyl-ACP synthase II [Aerococcus]MDK7049643.1 beta-ketoacyl-ACP synthase II [Aerococcus sanguinicola]OFT95852.1 beta-ketoacyl-[acyl-carrier-protein] synthase II [Aerococcus sp. HMSC23C02]
MTRRVVVTGLGAVTPLGNSVEDFWTNLKAGKHGIGPITKFDASGLDTQLVAEVKDFEPKDYMDRKSAKRMEPYAQYAIAASSEALKDAGLDLDQVDRDRVGIYFGTGIGGVQEMESGIRKMIAKGPKRVNPLFVPMAISNMGGANISMHFGIHGPAQTVSTACASANNAIGEAFRYIKHGYADYMLAGGGESSICEIAMSGFENLTAMNTTSDPDRASIPFDKERAGFIMGEGAGILLLESLESAQARGAKIYAEVAGYGATSDAYHLTAPHAEGQEAVKAIELALKEAGLGQGDVQYVNAHGTSTPTNDRVESHVIKTAFGDYSQDVAVTSTKAAVGHLLGAAGAVEAIASLKAMEESFIPGMVGYQVPDEDCDLHLVTGQGEDRQIDALVSNALGFGGHNTVICFKKVTQD